MIFCLVIGFGVWASLRKRGIKNVQAKITVLRKSSKPDAIVKTEITSLLKTVKYKRKKDAEKGEDVD